MAFTAILRRSASSLATLASRLTGVNINYHSVIFRTTSSHLYRKLALKYFMPAFDFSSTTEIKNLTLDELLPQIVDLECKFADHDNVSDILSDFPFKIEDNLDGYYNILLTREWYDENLKKTIHKYLEIRGIKPSMVEFLLGPYPTNKAKKKMLMNLKKIKNSLEQLS
ncbi:hypothetical protein ACOSP7_032496 [Xanthoceras sorbifolium]